MKAPCLLIIDTETTGLDPENDDLLEIGAVLFDTYHGIVVEAHSFLLWTKQRRNPMEIVNRIPPGALMHSWCFSEDEALTTIMGMLIRGDESRDRTYLVAHHADFDKKWVHFSGYHWICTYNDATWPRLPKGTGSLPAIALAYDVGIVRAHRALEDCLTLAAVLTRVREVENGLGDWMRRALEPVLEVHALVSYKRRDLAKDEGFRWDSERKVWWKTIRASAIDEFRKSMEFDTAIFEQEKES